MTRTKPVPNLQKRQDTTLRALRVLLALLFICYTAAMSVLLVLRGAQIPQRTLLLVPFQTIHSFFGAYSFTSGVFIINIVGNVLVFLPLGMFFQTFLQNKSAPRTVALVALCSFTAEALQFIFRVGYADIDDLILNTLGGLLGVVCYRIVVRLFQSSRLRQHAVLLAGQCAMCLVVCGMALRQLIF